MQTIDIERRAISVFIQDLLSPSAFTEYGAPSKRGILKAIEKYMATIKRERCRLPEEIVPYLKRLKDECYFGSSLVSRAIEKEQLLMWLIELSMELFRQSNEHKRPMSASE